VRALLLCAGFGTRLRPITDGLPKALVPVLNVPMILRRLAALARWGITEVAVNLHHEGRRIVEALEDAPPGGATVRFFWEPEILGTAGAIANAADFLGDEDFLVWNVDAEIEFDPAELARAHRGAGALSTLLVVGNPDPARFTPIDVADGRVRSFGQRVENPMLFTGVALHSPRVLPRIGAGRRRTLPDLWAPALAERPGCLAALAVRRKFFDLGTPSSLLEATLNAVESRADFTPEEGVFDERTRVLSSGGRLPGRLARTVAGRARVDESAQVESSILWDGADVEADCRIEECVVGPVRVPAGSRFRRVLLWPGPDGSSAAAPLQGFQPPSPAR
jgi:mannose-1-phosphate guanylyltransferase